MKAKLKRFLQTFFITLLVVYTTVFAYHSLSRASIGNQAFLNEKYIDKDYESNEVVAGDNKITSEIPSVTATLRPPTITLDDIYISVKTSKKFHRSRLNIIIKTWFQLAKDQTWFFTDSNDEEFQNKTGGHMINTKCASSHRGSALSCKLSAEFDTYLGSNKKWFCHFDDDNYVNVPRLVRFLGDYNSRGDWYFGKNSIPKPIQRRIGSKGQYSRVKFWFGTGGAGFCLSQALALKMVPIAGGGKFKSVSKRISLPDDVTMGYIVEHLARTPLTVVDQMHSHLEPMKAIRQEVFTDQISFSYSNKKEWNVVIIKGPFDTKEDPTRFLSLHCYLFPYFKFCPR